MENMEPVYHKDEPQSQTQPQPIFKAQAVVENNVAEKAKNDSTTNVVMAVILLAQLGFFGYMIFAM